MLTLERPNNELALAKSMNVFMMHGLFICPQFPYAQFHCASITEDMLFYQFWKAVFRLER